MKFRYDINALRAIAVIGVLLFHFKVPYFQGGFAGVDIFFVISGYLMTAIITNNINNNTFSIADFYGRRIKRIVPALLVLVIVVTVICFFIYFPHDYKLNERSAAASIAFVSNLYFLRHSGYFDVRSSTNIFLHTWSLSVEWQFYLVYPLILLVLNKWVKKRTFILVIFVAAICLDILICIIYLKKYPVAVFYLMPTRLWEMMLGGLAFYLQDLIATFKFKKHLAVLSYCLICFCFFFLKENMPWPGMFSILPTGATFLIIAFNAGNFKLQNNKLVQFIGRISYSLYLWHWPVYVIAVYLGFTFMPLFITLTILISVALAYLSYVFIERLEFERAAAILTQSTICLAVTGLLGTLYVNKTMFDSKTLKIAEYIDDHWEEVNDYFDDDGCFINGNNKQKDFNTSRCLSFSNKQPNILLLGDSHAADIAKPLRRALKEKGVNLMRAMSIGGVPTAPLNGALWCREMMGYMYNDFIKKNANQISGVILSGSWALNAKFNEVKLVADLDSTIRFFSNYNIPVVIIGQNENYFVAYSNIVAREYRFKSNIRDHYIDEYAHQLNFFLWQKFKPRYVNIYNEKQVPQLSQNGVPYMFDHDHFTKYGADLTVKKILSDSVFCRFLSTQGIK